MPLSVEEYLVSKGRVCPACEGCILEGREVNIEDGVLYQVVVCSCGASWVDKYKLVSYFDLETD